MFKKLPRNIALYLYEKGAIKEYQFTKLYQTFSNIMFFIISFSSYVLIGFMLSQTREMFLAILIYNGVLNVLNRGFHMTTQLNCMIFSGFSILLNLEIGLLLNSLFSFQYSLIIYNVIIAIILIKLTLSEIGIVSIRLIEVQIRKMLKHKIE